MFVKGLLDLGDNLLDIGITDIHTNDHPSACRIPVNLQGTIDEGDGCHFAGRDLDAFVGADKEFV